MKKRNLLNKNVIPKEVTVRSSAAEYLTFIAATGDNPDSIEMRYEDENVWIPVPWTRKHNYPIKTF